MTAYEDLLRCQVIRIDRLDYTVVDPACLIPLPICFGAGSYRETRCETKAESTLDFRTMVYGLDIPLQGRPLGSHRGRELIRWEIDDRTERTLFGFRIERLVGQLTVAVATIPARVDLEDCARRRGEFFVELGLVDPADRTDNFDGPTPLPNELKVEISGASTLRAVVTGLAGWGGITAPPAGPWPQPASIAVSTHCIASRHYTQSVFGTLRLTSPFHADHANPSVTIEAFALDAGERLDVIRSEIVGDQVSFEVLVPAGVTGRVRVSGFTNDRSQARFVRFRVSASGSGCREPELGVYNRVLIGCEEIDCGWTGLNDLGAMIGRLGGDPVLYLPTGNRVERLGRELGANAYLRALNNRNAVAGVVRHDDGRVTGFVRDSDVQGGPRLRFAEDVAFTALNSQTVAVGMLSKGGESLPVRWSDGRLEPLALPVPGAVPLAIDDGGAIAGVFAAGEGEPPRAFLLEGEDFRDLGALGGDIVALHMSGSGALAATLATAEGRRGVLLADQGLIDIPLPEGADGLVVAGINDQGVVAATAYVGGRPRAARFSAETGVALLDGLADGADVALGEAIAINNLGQILAAGRRGAEVVHAILSRAATETPRVPFPAGAAGGACRCAETDHPAWQLRAGPAPTLPWLAWLLLAAMLILLMVMLVLVLARLAP